MNRHVAVNQSLHGQAQKDCKKKEKEYFGDIGNLRNRLLNFVKNYVTTEKQTDQLSIKFQPEELGEVCSYTGPWPSIFILSLIHI